MFEALLVTTSTEGLSARGNREQRAFELISETVRDNLGDDHAALFAEPVSTEHGDRFDWYASVSGKATLLTELNEEDGAALRDRIAVLSDDIRGLADKLSADGSADGLRLGEALNNALMVPGDGYVYAIQTEAGLQPVFVNWAWTADTHRAERGTLSGADPRAAARAAAEAKAAASAAKAAQAEETARAAAIAADRTPFRWFPWLLGLGWLLLALMIAAIIWLLIAPCALNGPQWLNFCPERQATASEHLTLTAVLEDEIDQLERRIAIADRACQPPPPPPRVVEVPAPPAPPPPPPPPDPPATPQEDDITKRLRQAGANLGDLNFSLAWDGRSDVDIAVTCPSGQTVSYRRRNACRGKLDVDSNVNSIRAKPVENIVFNNPRPGRYKVTVTLYKQRDRGSLPFEVLIRDRSGGNVKSGVLNSRKRTWTTTINYAGN